MVRFSDEVKSLIFWAVILCGFAYWCMVYLPG
jgi:hypothetical protein